MKWVRVDDAHFNTNLICSFFWVRGKLWIWFLGDDDPTAYQDPKRENYIRLCHALGVAPIGEDLCGENRPCKL